MPRRVLPLMRLPALSWLPGHIPAHEANQRARSFVAMQAAGSRPLCYDKAGAGHGEQAPRRHVCDATAATGLADRPRSGRPPRLDRAGQQQAQDLLGTSDLPGTTGPGGWTTARARNSSRCVSK